MEKRPDLGAGGADAPGARSGVSLADTLATPDTGRAALRSSSGADEAKAADAAAAADEAKAVVAAKAAAAREAGRARAATQVLARPKRAGGRRGYSNRLAEIVGRRGGLDEAPRLTRKAAADAGFSVAEQRLNAQAAASGVWPLGVVRRGARPSRALVAGMLAIGVIGSGAALGVVGREADAALQVEPLPDLSAPALSLEGEAGPTGWRAAQSLSSVPFDAASLQTASLPQAPRDNGVVDAPLQGAFTRESARRRSLALTDVAADDPRLAGAVIHVSSAASGAPGAATAYVALGAAGCATQELLVAATGASPFDYAILQVAPPQSSECAEAARAALSARLPARSSGQTVSENAGFTSASAFSSDAALNEEAAIARGAIATSSVPNGPAFLTAPELRRLIAERPVRCIGAETPAVGAAEAAVCAERITYDVGESFYRRRMLWDGAMEVEISGTFAREGDALCHYTPGLTALVLDGDFDPAAAMGVEADIERRLRAEADVKICHRLRAAAPAGGREVFEAETFVDGGLLAEETALEPFEMLPLR